MLGQGPLGGEGGTGAYFQLAGRAESLRWMIGCCGGCLQGRLFTGRHISRWRLDGLTGATQWRRAESGLQEFSQAQGLIVCVRGEGMGSHHSHIPERGVCAIASVLWGWKPERLFMGEWKQGAGPGSRKKVCA